MAMHRFVYRRLVLAQVLSNSNRSVGQDLVAPHLVLFSDSGVVRKGKLLFTISINKLFSTGDVLVQRKQTVEWSFTMSYLVNSCGLSPEIAKSVASKVKFQSSEQPDSVVQFFKNHGFTDAEIAKLVRGRPNLLLANPEKSVLPKLEFFKSIGVSDAELGDVCSSNPTILCCSLENLLIPIYNFLKSMALSDENVVKVFRKKSRIYIHDLQKIVSLKLAVLTELGMPEQFIPMVLTCYSTVVLLRQDKFDEIVKKVIKLGFNPQKTTFIHAMQVFASNPQPNLEHKLGVFRKWGWSDEHIKLAFRRCPNHWSASENKINSVFDFLVNKMGWQSTAITAYPGVFLLNLEKRIIPRCMVIKVLQSKGLVKKSLNLWQVVAPVEKVFFQRFVAEHVDDFPELVNIYTRKEGLKALETRTTR